MIKKVIIVGGGVGGLSAAHELIERGFHVVVYERNRRGEAGGKARSVDTKTESDWYARSGKDASKRGRKKDGLPGEHGFRFFPGWYRHLPDTMARIPYKGDGRTVFDNLVPADTALFASYDREPVRALVRFPANWQDLRRLASFPQDILRLGLTVEDLSFFLGKIWTFLTSSEDRRLAEFETQSWWEFMEADRQSKAFRDYLVIGTTRSLVAAKPREASAYTIAKMVLQTMFDVARPDTYIDRLLNGPTSEVWIDPWIEYLEAQGVEFRFEHELQSIEFDGKKEISRVRLFRPPYAARCAQERLDAARRLQEFGARMLGWWNAWSENTSDSPERILREVGRTIPEDVDPLERARLIDAVLKEPTEALSSLLPWVTKKLESNAKDPTNGAAALLKMLKSRIGPAITKAREAIDREVQDRQAKLDDLLDERALIEAGEATDSEGNPVPPAYVEDRADFYVFSLPVEQMAYYVHRSESIQKLDPSLKNIERLSEHVDWMAGIQFYLNDEIGITRGHIDFLDSEWHLTGLAQTQFWSKDHDIKDYGNGTVRAILSVDISSWDTPGRVFQRPAWDCTPDEISEEVWAQLKASLNRPGAPPILRDDMRCDGEDRSYYLDQSIADRYDRRKQGFYEKFRSVGFDTSQLVDKASHSGQAGATPEAHGGRLLRNAEPLLVNRPGSWRLRPDAITDIRNMFLAADYVHTNTNLATMEGANEAARRAVNEILKQCRETHRPCKIWSLWEPLGALRSIDEHLYERQIRFEDTGGDIPVRIIAGAAKQAAALAGRAMSAFLTTSYGTRLTRRPPSSKGTP